MLIELIKAKEDFTILFWSISEPFLNQIFLNLYEKSHLLSSYNRSIDRFSIKSSGKPISLRDLFEHHLLFKRTFLIKFKRKFCEEISKKFLCQTNRIIFRWIFQLNFINNEVSRWNFLWKSSWRCLKKTKCFSLEISMKNKEKKKNFYCKNAINERYWLKENFKSIPWS
jgi:hypothetical protein